MRLIIFFILLFSHLSAFATERLIVEPDDGRGPLIDAIQHAHSSISLVMYGLTDKAFIQALEQAKNQGKDIQVLLESHPYKSEGENNRAISHFNFRKIDWRTANPAFKLTHQKTLLLDQDKAVIMTFNLTYSTFKNERNFALMIDDPAEISEITQVFKNDWLRKSSNLSCENLIWGPQNSREKLKNFIQSAHSSIKMYAQDISDYETIGLLAQAARSGIRVDVLCSKMKGKKMEYLRHAGVKVQTQCPYLIHAKVIIADHQRALLGSMNFTRPSIEENRELDVITYDKKTIQRLEKIFDEDFTILNSG